MDAPESPTDESADSASGAVDVALELAEYRARLSTETPTDIVRRYVTGGRCFLLTDDLYFELRREVAQAFGVHPDEVIVVGSAKLGFSIAPDQRYKPFDDRSDIDVALVSPELFDAIWLEALTYDRSGGDWPSRQTFRRYLFRGWIRPDAFPPSTLFPRAANWTSFFEGVTSSGRFGMYPIKGGLYRSREFLEMYQEEAVSACIDAEGQHE